MMTFAVGTGRGVKKQKVKTPQRMFVRTQPSQFLMMLSRSAPDRHSGCPRYHALPTESCSLSFSACLMQFNTRIQCE